MVDRTDEMQSSSFLALDAQELDARQLQLMLYREIGIAAVAAALASSREDDKPIASLSATQELATSLLAEDKAA